MSNQNSFTPSIMLLLGGFIVGCVLGVQLCLFDETLPKRQAALADLQRLNQLAEKVIHGIEHLNTEEVRKLTIALEENLAKFTEIITEQHQYESQLDESNFYLPIVFALIIAAGMIMSTSIHKGRYTQAEETLTNAYSVLPILAEIMEGSQVTAQSPDSTATTVAEHVDHSSPIGEN